MNPIVHPLFVGIALVLQVYFVVLIVYVLVGWLFAFNVVSGRNSFVGTIWNLTRSLSEPVVRPFRRMIPPISGFDLSVLVVLLILQFLIGSLPWLEAKIQGAAG